MRFVSVQALGLATLCACSTAPYDGSPPYSRFYFPTGVVHVPSAVSPEGMLYVASANFDKRFDTGSIIGVNLSQVALPAFGLPVGPQGPVEVTDLKTTKDSMIEITSFSGEMAALDLGQGRVRLFVPSRSEGDAFQAVDVVGPSTSDGQATLSCATPVGATSRDCGSNAPSLNPVSVQNSVTGLPRAPSPYGVTVRPRRCTVAADCGTDVCSQGRCLKAAGDEYTGDVFVTHLAQADSPYLSGLNYQAYLVKIDSSALTVDASNYLAIGVGGSNSVAAGQRWAYVSGRYLNPSPNLLRLVDNDGLMEASGLEVAFRVSESRGIALSSDETSIFVAGRGPDTLFVVSVIGATSDSPGLALARVVPLPQGPDEMTVVSRPGRGDLVLISCSTAGVVVIYDDEAGEVAAQVSGVGLQPYSVAVDRRAAGARVYVSNFSDGRVGVIDIPDLNQPQGARLVAHLGEQQLCLTRGPNEAACDGGTQ